MLGGWAVWYAQQGWPVFPAHGFVRGQCTCRSGPDCQSPGKHPATRWGWKDATLDERQIRAWWDENPDYNIALATGDVSVIDIDGAKGLQSFKKLVAEYGVGSIPKTPRAVTGGGGWHLFFQGSEIKNHVGIRPGLDTRSGGGYVVLPPSRHWAGNAYRFDRCPTEYRLQPFPPWMEKLTRERDPAFAVKPTPGEIVRVEIKDIGPIPDGKRNDTLTRICGRFFWEGYEPSEVARLLGSVNTMHCAPPLSVGEVERIVWNILRKREDGEDDKRI